MQKGQRFVALEFYEVAMFYLFKDLKIKYITIAIILLITLLTLTSYSFVNSTVIITSLSPMCYPCAILLITIVLNRITLKRLNRITEIMNEECDPYKYIEQILPLTQQKLNNNTKVLILIYLACGYINAGDIKQAKMVLADIAKIGTYNKILLANISNLWITLYIKENDLKNAQLALADLWNFLSLQKSNKINYQFTRIYNRQAAVFNMQSNKLEGVEEVFNTQLKSIESSIEKNSLYYNLALLYIKQNRIEEAMQALQFVIANGNKLHLVTLAKEKLAQLNADIQ
ncbi:MAG: hypothetical protein J1E85_06605 [Ruminococcus sp.]|nr:hypothetical protein [Ruminococcus sp.]